MATDSALEWTDIVPAALRAPVVAYQHRHALAKLWKRLLVAAGRGDTTIVVTGRSGVGKSLLTDASLDTHRIASRS
jgi:putative ribosome biogenesis GTPase RsgA